ncbi:hypothetical protein [Streptomyces avermitilis]
MAERCGRAVRPWPGGFGADVVQVVGRFHAWSGERALATDPS